MSVNWSILGCCCNAAVKFFLLPVEVHACEAANSWPWRLVSIASWGEPEQREAAGELHDDRCSLMWPALTD
jgi:hypothetical protein